jgi:hypothetical protein
MSRYDASMISSGQAGFYIHPTLAEGFWTLMEEVKPVDSRRPRDMLSKESGT